MIRFVDPIPLLGLRPGPARGLSCLGELAGKGLRRRELLAQQFVEPLERRELLSSTYYVSTGGSDSSAGTSDALAFRTLQKAANVVGAGDTVVVRAGTYVGMNLFGKAGGTQAAPIKFLADPGVKVTTVSSTGVNANLADINLESAGGWYVIRGFDVESDGTAQRGGIRVVLTSHVQVVNNTVNHAYIGIFTSNGDDLLIQGNVCSNSTDQHGIYMSLNEHGCVIRGNVLFGNNWDGLHMNALVGSPNDGALVEGNVSYGNKLSGMDIEGVTGATYRNNVIYGNAKHGITLHSQDQTTAGDPTPATANNLFVNNTIVAGNAIYTYCIQMRPEDMRETLFNNVLVVLPGGQGAAIGIDEGAGQSAADAG